MTLPHQQTRLHNHNTGFHTLVVYIGNVGSTACSKSHHHSYHIMAVFTAPLWHVFHTHSHQYHWHLPHNQAANHFTPLHIPPPATFWGICWLYVDWTLSHMNSHGDHTPCAHYFFGPMEPFTATALSYCQSTWPAVPSILCGWSGMQDIFFGFQHFLLLVVLSHSQLVTLSGGPNFSVSTGSPPDQVFLQACPTLGATPGLPPEQHSSRFTLQPQHSPWAHPQHWCFSWLAPSMAFPGFAPNTGAVSLAHLQLGVLSGCPNLAFLLTCPQNGVISLSGLPPDYK